MSQTAKKTVANPMQTKFAFTDAERAAWEWSADQTPTMHAAETRIMPADSPYPGPFDPQLTPYAIEPTNAFIDPEIEQIWLMWAAQTAKTTVAENIAGFIIDRQPGPTLWVEPRDEDLETIKEKRLRPMIELSEKLSRHCLSGKRALAGDFWDFDAMTLYFGIAGSAASLSSKSIKNVILNEADKFPLFAGREANPVSLAEKRMTAFWDSKLIGMSTPTTKKGHTNTAYEYRSNRCELYLPCPKCGEFSVWKFPALRWPKKIRNPGEIIDADDLWIDCPICAHKIREEQKPECVAANRWVPAGQAIDAEGDITGTATRSKRISGYKLSALVSPFAKAAWRYMASAFLTANNAVGRATGLMMDFQNSWLGEPYEETARHVEKKEAKKLIGDYSNRTVPAESVLLVAGADYHKSRTRGIVRIDYEVMAYGPDMRNYTVTSGSVNSFAALDKVIFADPYPWADGTKADKKPFMSPAVMFIDAGFEPDDVYSYCRNKPMVTIPTLGEVGPFIGDPLRVKKLEQVTERRLTARQRRRYRGMMLIQFDTFYFKNMVTSWLSPTVEQGENDEVKVIAPPLSSFYAECPEYYFAELTNEQLIAEPDRKGNTKYIWKAIRADYSHSLDTHVLCAAAGHYKGAHYRTASQPSHRKTKKPPAKKRGGFLDDLPKL